ncbi:MAG: SigE family RNA polymerase sigma factor [Acidimicrobiia bacterium]|nr:SigE family RNA polymerase sigma factor [Acidimicrobiia bacterium]
MDRDEALSDLYQDHYRSLVRLAAILVDDREAAEDVVQDAFVKAYRSWGRLKDPAAAPAYLRSIVLNTARSGLRRRLVAARHRPAAPPPTAAADESVLLSEDRREVLDALRALPRRQRECLTLRYYLDCSEAEIAATLGISTGSVKSHASRGLAALAGRLEARR